MNKLSLWMNNLFYGSQILATQYAMALSELRKLNQANNFDARFEALPVSRGADLEGDGELRMQEAILSTVKEY
ncbi:hypothetical protein SPFM20_00159 [Salmonella phage SPFM20]|nr:hypothetical protein SPFM20_00159 [Salmonella phage SPFM20]